MAIILFVFPPVAGCVDRMVVNTPYVRAVNTQQGVVNHADPATTWAFIRQLPYPWPPNMNPKPFLLNGKTGQGATPQPDLLCIQMAAPELSRQMVNSGMPTGAPYGNPGAPLTPPPMVMPQPQVAQPQPQMPGQPMPPMAGAGKVYEELPDAALPGAPDELFGGDAQGGTYTDIDSTGQEIKRTLVQQAPPPPQQRR